MQGSQWLLWQFETDATLGAAIDGSLGKFPACVEEIILGRVNDNLDEQKRDVMVIKSIMKQVRSAILLRCPMGSRTAVC